MSLSSIRTDISSSTLLRVLVPNISMRLRTHRGRTIWMIRCPLLAKQMPMLTLHGFAILRMMLAS